MFKQKKINQLFCRIFNLWIKTRISNLVRTPHFWDYLHQVRPRPKHVWKNWKIFFCGRWFFLTW
jgi:hypothetical protein